MSLALRWLLAPTADDRAGLADLVAEVVAAGGAVGWLEAPAPAEVDAWLSEALAGGARFALARDDGRVVGCGYWQRHLGPVLRRNAQLSKLMTAPRARGRGVARLVATALVDDARAAGVEVLTLAARGNNHAALGLYASLGFATTGRRPDFVAVGDERFDEVLMHLDLRTDPGGLVRYGGLRSGPGST